MPYFIYQLTDPRDNEARYIGLSVDPERRYREHLSGLYSTEPMLQWLNELETMQISPIMVVLEEVETLENARERELTWIKIRLDQGGKLLNILRGEGRTTKQVPFYFTEEQQDKLEDLVYLYNKEHRGRRINRQDIIRYLIDQADIDDLQDLTL